MLSEERIAISQRERDVLQMLGTVLSGERPQAEAARLLGKSARQVRRIQRRLDAEGDVGVVHRLGGQHIAPLWVDFPESALQHLKHGINFVTFVSGGDR